MILYKKSATGAMQQWSIEIGYLGLEIWYGQLGGSMQEVSVEIEENLSGISWEELSALMNKAGLSASGSIMDRNSDSQPWVTKMDISIKQEIPGFAKGHKAQVYLMVDNFANLLNSDWGVEKRLSYPNQTLYDFGGLDDQGRYILDKRFDGASTLNYSTIDLGSSAWQAKIGVSYKF